MITGMHSIVYASDPDASRAFFRDVLRLPNVDLGHGWLIFQQPQSELAVHPAPEPGGSFQLFLMCDDITETMAELTARGAIFTAPVTQASWGLLTSIQIPGGGEIGLYEPRHRTAYDL